MNYEEYMAIPVDNKFKYFMDTLFLTNRTPSFWVNWDNVKKNMREHEINLNTLNYLIGKENIEDEAKRLFQEQPKLLKSIPILLASRDKELDVLKITDSGDLSTYHLDFENPDITKINRYISFLNESGLLSFLQNKLDCSLVDYVYGIQAGLDSNGRKNRGGAQNERILETNLKKLTCKFANLEYTTQATRSLIKKHWNINVPEALDEGKAGGRRYDGAIYNKETNQVTIIETNFYAGGGSKLKSVCGEFDDMYGKHLKAAENIDFIWITDGQGWKTAQNPLSDAFRSIPKIFNLNMVNKGFLEKAIK